MRSLFYSITITTIILCFLGTSSVFAIEKDVLLEQNTMVQTIFLAGAELKLGMDKNQVLDAINKSYKLNEDKSNDLWTITEGEGNATKPIGYVQFQNNKLNNAMKDWGSFVSEDGYNFGQAILSTVMQLKNEWKYSVNMDTHSIRQPSSTYNTIYIYYGKKHIHIGVTERIVGRTQVRSMSVQEYLWK